MVEVVALVVSSLGFGCRGINLDVHLATEHHAQLTQRRSELTNLDVGGARPDVGELFFCLRILCRLAAEEMDLAEAELAVEHERHGAVLKLQLFDIHAGTDRLKQAIAGVIQAKHVEYDLLGFTLHRHAVADIELAKVLGHFVQVVLQVRSQAVAHAVDVNGGRLDRLAGVDQ